MEEEDDEEREKWKNERSRVLDVWSEIELRGRDALKVDIVHEPGSDDVGVETPLEVLYPKLVASENQNTLLQKSSDEPSTSTASESTTWQRVLRVCLCRPEPAVLPALAHTHKALIISLSEVPYQNDNPTHWLLLYEYFRSIASIALNSSSMAVQCPRTGPHWQIVGFQGNDPATDFRGCGIFGLLQLHSFSQRVNPEKLQAIVKLSRSEPNDFPLAVVSLNITGLILSHLKRGNLNSLGNDENGLYPSISALHAACLTFFCNQYKFNGSTLAQCQSILSTIDEGLLRNPRAILSPLQNDVLV
ncbi:unnamed protein product [Caenorhabditis auriculariae]|uniref:ELMO domain-containing protein n=1 Tax=Caenorhabditis auriculariae TaxID=2777116 RepID=A0A8S1GT19_9PELO|nr:unnamed protein product [Caenorhabditis auriculariae]